MRCGIFFPPLDFCIELQLSYNWSPLWADILKANFIEFLSPPFDKFKFKILLECWEKTQLCNLYFSAMWCCGLWGIGAHLLNIHCFILSFSRGEIVKLENIFWNITRNNSILRKCDLISTVLPMKIWKIHQLTTADIELVIPFTSTELVLFSWLPFGEGVHRQKYKCCPHF